MGYKIAITDENAILTQMGLELGTLKDVERSLEMMEELTVNVHNWATLEYCL